MGLHTILKKLKKKERELRLLILCVQLATFEICGGGGGRNDKRWTEKRAALLLFSAFFLLAAAVSAALLGNRKAGGTRLRSSRVVALDRQGRRPMTETALFPW